VAIQLTGFESTGILHLGLHDDDDTTEELQIWSFGRIQSLKILAAIPVPRAKRLSRSKRLSGYQVQGPNY
jgi:hypothetical protein